MRTLLLNLLAGATLPVLAAAPATNAFLASIPAGYSLQAYDDCGVEGRQPHVVMQDCYLWTFNTSDTEAGPKERSSVFSYKGIQAVYTNLDPNLSYVLALTYASDHVYHRVQSLEANGIALHGPYALPKAVATRLIVKVPSEVTRAGRMTLSWKIHGEVNATVSIIELWANAPAPNGLQFTALAGLPATLQGQVLNLAYDPVTGAKVTAGTPGSEEIVTTTTGPEGIFTFPRSKLESLSPGDELVFTAASGTQKSSTRKRKANLFFEPVRYRPLPGQTANLATNCLLLNGAWVLNPAPGNDIRTQPLEAPGWRRFNVPGQWLQQGFDVPRDKTAAVAREFTLPEDWAGNRVILRFDAIHAGTRYWLNGQELGDSENLFTPVEWDITTSARFGQANRLDLEMKVDTVSERLSVSSDYAFHNLGGIDRAVRVFALPPICLRQLHLNAGLDQAYQNGELRLDLGLESATPASRDLELRIHLRDPKGQDVSHSVSRVPIGAFTGSKAVQVTTKVTKPLPWSAEKPNLYHLALELRSGANLLERIERNIGFRNIEVRGSQLYVNGQRIKAAGVCHHEMDPLSGRADTARHAETDVRLLKAANLNWIRTSHYPPTAELLDAADRLGMYVEAEAPFCWVGGALDHPTNLLATLTPTSAMLDYHHAHPSVIVWSLANESHFNLQFLASAHLCRDLDPTRPTTFNHDFASSPLAAITDIANLHYPPWPYDQVLPGDPRPLYFGEYFFEITHEQTDVRINPGLRELWGQGHTEPDSAYGRALTADHILPPLKPGLAAGGWSYIYHSDRLLGGAIWASHDDAFYLSETNHAGYAWHHGFWGLIDSWRRPKPEWWLARHIFSPVWLLTRHAEFTPGRERLRVPVENRYVFTDFGELNFDWELNRQKGRITPRLAPGARGELEIPLPAGTSEGDRVFLRVTHPSGEIINESAIWIGREKSMALPKPVSGAPRWHEADGKIIIEAGSFTAVFDRSKGDFDPADSRHSNPVTSFPSIHVTRYDFGDLNGPKSPPYAVFPDRKTRRLEKVDLEETPTGLRLTVRERYEHFDGSTSWLLDRDGRGLVTADYTYSGPIMDTREAGIHFLVKSACDEVTWRRWSEWGVFPPESISRAEGTAKARREAKWGLARWNQPPAWPWSLDETELGTADFRSAKYHIYEAALKAPNGTGVSWHANANAHFRSALTPEGVAAHWLWRCPLGQVPLKPGDRLQGECVVQLRPHQAP